jgi:predicted amidohydrolase YtcJ
VSPQNPVWLTHASGHAGFANAKAMELAGVTKATPDPKGGQLLKDAKGLPTGLFNERAQSIIADALARDLAKRTRAQVDADLRRDIELASQESLSKGLTTVSDAGSPPATIELMKKVVDERKLPVRVWMMLRETPDKLAADMPKYRVVNYGDKRFTVRAIKRGRRRARIARRLMWSRIADLPTTSGSTPTLEDAAGVGARRDQRLPGASTRIGRSRQPEVLNAP